MPLPRMGLALLLAVVPVELGDCTHATIPSPHTTTPVVERRRQWVVDAVNSDDATAGDHATAFRTLTVMGHWGQARVTGHEATRDIEQDRQIGTFALSRARKLAKRPESTWMAYFQVA